MQDSRDHSRISEQRRPRPLRFLVAGLILQTATLAPWVGLALVEQGSAIAMTLTVTAILLHAASAACLIVATGFGILNLIRRVRPAAPQVLSALAIPIAAVLLIPILVVLFAITT